jgi:hypothetical protein
MATLITIAEFKSKSLVHGNVESDRLKILLDRSQEMYLRPILGREFYNHITTTSTPTAAELELINDYIKPLIVCSTEIMAAKHFNWEVRNKSTGVSNDQYQRASDWDENDKLVNDYRKQAEYYKSEMLWYINANRTDFPLFKCVEPTNSFQSSVGFATRRTEFNPKYSNNGLLRPNNDRT